MVGWHPLNTWASTQATVALSSGESELYALTKGASQALGFIALASDLGDKLDARVHTHASAKLGIVNRQGLGKLRHVKVQYLWLQERVRSKELMVNKVAGPDNPADLMTKYLPAADMEKHLEFLAIDRRLNRAEAAPRLGLSQLQATDSWHEPTPHAEGSSSVHEGVEVVRVHNRPRRGLFTPMRVEGSPPSKALASTRRTEGKFLDDGKRFTIVDEWRGRPDPHRDLARAWVGKTVFMMRTHASTTTSTAPPTPATDTNTNTATSTSTCAGDAAARHPARHVANPRMHR